MKAMVCEMCGSQDLVKQDGMFVCQNCGTKYSVEEAKKLLGTVKVDKTEETEKLLVLALPLQERTTIVRTLRSIMVWFCRKTPTTGRQHFSKFIINLCSAK